MSCVLCKRRLTNRHKTVGSETTYLVGVNDILQLLNSDRLRSRSVASTCPHEVCNWYERYVKP